MKYRIYLGLLLGYYGFSVLTARVADSASPGLTIPAGLLAAGAYRTMPWSWSGGYAGGK